MKTNIGIKDIIYLNYVGDDSGLTDSFDRIIRTQFLLQFDFALRFLPGWGYKNARCSKNTMVGIVF